jgi:hypothetical protein
MTIHTRSCACGCGERTKISNGKPRKYILGHNRRGRGTGWIECGYRYVSVSGQKIAEHRYIMERELGRKLHANEVVHHVDGNKLNNDIPNLCVLSRAEHARLHSTAKKRRWSEAEKRRARYLKARGYSTQDVARMLGRGMTSTIRYACNRRRAEC